MKRLGLQTDIAKYGSIDKIFFHAVPSNVYAAPMSIGNGDGSSAANACELQTVIQSGNVISGDTVILINGTYGGLYIVYVNNITITSLNCYLAVIDGGFQIGDYIGVSGSFVTVKNIRFYNSDPNRGTWITPQGTMARQTNIVLAAPNVSIINNIIHDGGVGITAYNDSPNAIIYGNIIFNSGWADDNQGGCQNIYYHGNNQDVKHNIFAGAFKKTFAAYGNNGAALNSDILENVIFSRGSTLIGAGNVATDLITFIGNHVIYGGLQCGYTFNPNGTITVTDNIIYTTIAAGEILTYFQNIISLRNKIIAGAAAIGGYQGQSITLTNPIMYAYNFNNNEYHHLGVLSHFVNVEGAAGYTFAQWQLLGYDLASTYNNVLPVVNESFVYLNDYADSCRRGFIVIWNWEGLLNVNVDLTALGLVDGNTYRWRQSQDPLIDIDTFVYNAGVDVTFPMTGHSVAFPIGFGELLIPDQFPLFGCFIIESV